MGAELRVVIDNSGRPVKRADCLEGPRPCPHSRCRYHLQREIAEDKLPEAPIETCALDLADRGRNTLEEIAPHMGVSRERIRQMEAEALRKLRIRGGRILVELRESIVPEPDYGGRRPWE